MLRQNQHLNASAKSHQPFESLWLIKEARRQPYPNNEQIQHLFFSRMFFDDQLRVLGATVLYVRHKQLLNSPFKAGMLLCHLDLLYLHFGAFSRRF